MGSFTMFFANHKGAWSAPVSATATKFKRKAMQKKAFIN
jgi:hypothetical protein